MDQHWEYESWDPSAGIPYEFRKPLREVHRFLFISPPRNVGWWPSQEVERLINELIEATKDLQASPYNPQFWWKRADHLVKLGYPELGAVDAYKGLILTKAAFDYRSLLGETVRLSWGMYLFVINSGKVSEHTCSGNFLGCLLTVSAGHV